jgi:hypothetical protein
VTQRDEIWCHLERKANPLGNPRRTYKNSIEGHVDGLRTITASRLAVDSHVQWEEGTPAK